MNYQADQTLNKQSLKELQELTSDLTEEGTNAEFEETERSTESGNKITAAVYPTQNKHKTHKSSSKITPTVLDTSKKKTRVTKIVENTDMLKVSNIENHHILESKK